MIRFVCWGVCGQKLLRERQTEVWWSMWVRWQSRLCFWWVWWQLWVHRLTCAMIEWYDIWYVYMWLSDVLVCCLFIYFLCSVCEIAFHGCCCWWLSNCTDDFGELPQLWNPWKVMFCLPQLQGFEGVGRSQVGFGWLGCGVVVPRTIRRYSCLWSKTVRGTETAPDNPCW